MLKEVHVLEGLSLTIAAYLLRTRTGMAFVTLPTLGGKYPAHHTALFLNGQFNWISVGVHCRSESNVCQQHKFCLPLIFTDLLTYPTENFYWYRRVGW